MKKSKNSIYNKLISVNIYNSTIPILIIAFTLILFGIIFNIMQSSKQSANIINSIEISSEVYLNNYITTLDEIHSSIILNAKNNSTISSSLNIYNDNNVEIERILLLNDSGNLINSSPFNADNIGIDFSGHDYYKKLVNKNDVFWSDIFISYDSNKPLVTVTKKYDDSIIVLEINLDELTDFLQVFDITNNSYIAITDSNGSYIAHSDPSFVNTRSHDSNHLALKENNNIYTKYNDLSMIAYYTTINNTRWGIIFYQSIWDLIIPIIGFLILSSIILFIIGSHSLLITTKFNKDLDSELQDLLNWTNSVANGIYSIKLNSGTYAEFEMLSHSFEDMIDGILKREELLQENRNEIAKINENLEILVEKRTQELQNSIKNLKLAQEKLIQSEKMAALGSLVSGVSHELNTPIGIAVTAASFLKTETLRIQEKVKTNTIKKSEIDKYFTSMNKTTNIVLEGSSRAADLISSFKQTAIDQQKMDKKYANFKNIINSTITLLTIDLKKKNIQVNTNYSGNLEVKTFPGAISQIITNLMQNSIFHAFKDQKTPIIEINCFENIVDNAICIEYYDNGSGIPLENINKIYDPFFTTALGNGGNGLGLNIVYNLITGLLLGSIEYKDSPDKGVFFKITLPKNID